MQVWGRCPAARQPATSAIGFRSRVSAARSCLCKPVAGLPPFLGASRRQVLVDQSAARRAERGAVPCCGARVPMCAVAEHDARCARRVRFRWAVVHRLRSCRLFFLSRTIYPPRSSVQASQQYSKNNAVLPTLSESQSRRLTRRRHHLRQDNYPQRNREDINILYIYTRLRETHTHATQWKQPILSFSHFVYISAYKLRVYNHKHYCVRPSAPFYKCMTKCMANSL